MTTHDRDKIIAVAEEVKANNDRFGDFSVALYAIAFEAGRQAEREECAKVCDRVQFTGYVPPEDGNAAEYYDDGAEECADQIRARGDMK